MRRVLEVMKKPSALTVVVVVKRLREARVPDREHVRFAGAERDRCDAVGACFHRLPFAAGLAELEPDRLGAFGCLCRDRDRGGLGEGNDAEDVLTFASLRDRNEVELVFVLDEDEVLDGDVCGRCERDDWRLDSLAEVEDGDSAIALGDLEEHLACGRGGEGEAVALLAHAQVARSIDAALRIEPGHFDVAHVRHGHEHFGVELKGNLELRQLIVRPAHHRSLPVVAVERDLVIRVVELDGHADLLRTRKDDLRRRAVHRIKQRGLRRRTRKGDRDAVVIADARLRVEVDRDETRLFDDVGRDLRFRSEVLELGGQR